MDTVPSIVSRIRIKDGRMNRIVPVDSTIGTIEIDLSGDEATIVLPSDVPVTVESG